MLYFSVGHISINLFRLQLVGMELFHVLEICLGSIKSQQWKKQKLKDKKQQVAELQQGLKSAS